eukprot:g3537.t1
MVLKIGRSLSLRRLRFRRPLTSCVSSSRCFATNASQSDESHGGIAPPPPPTGGTPPPPPPSSSKQRPVGISPSRSQWQSIQASRENARIASIRTQGRLRVALDLSRSKRESLALEPGMEELQTYLRQQTGPPMEDVMEMHKKQLDEFYSTSQEELNAGWKGPHMSQRTGLIGIKSGMCTLFDDYGNSHPCTVVRIDQCHVVGIKRGDPSKPAGRHRTGVNGINASQDFVGLQVAAGVIKAKRVSKPLLGHFRRANVPPCRELAEFRVSPDAVLPLGTELRAGHFLPGQYVDVQGRTKGKGWQGVMKRHGFKGQPASHGHSKHRHGGSIGSSATPSKVHKGMRMPGQMGGKQATQRNLRVMKVIHNWTADQEDGGEVFTGDLLFLRGAIPGPIGSFLRVFDAISMRGKYRYLFDDANSDSANRMGCKYDPLGAPPFPTHVRTSEDSNGVFQEWDAPLPKVDQNDLSELFEEAGIKGF